MNTLPRKVGTATIRWSQEAQIKLPVTLLDKVGELRIAMPNRAVYQARFDAETGVLMFRGGPIAGEQWMPVLTSETTWIRRVHEAGGLTEVLEVPPEMPDDDAGIKPKRGRGKAAK